jgi:integrase
MSRRLANKLLAILHGIFEYAVRKHGLLRNPVKDVEKLRESYDAARFDFYSPEEVRELVAKAGDSQDGVLYLTAAFSGLRRGELIGLLWEDVDFENHSIRVWETVTLRERGLPKSRKSRTVPMVDDVAGALKGLKVRERYTQPKDSVFAGEDSGPIDGSALRRRYIADLERAGLRFLRFHDLRHLRLAGDQPRLDCPGPGVDGPRRHQDDVALPARQEPRRRRAVAVQRLPARRREARRSCLTV